MRAWLRVVGRISALVLITTAAVLLVGATRPFRRWAAVRQVRLRNRTFAWWGRSFLRVVGGRLQVEGPPPRGAFYLVTNHLGYLDVPVLASIVDAAFVGKSELRHWPIVGGGIALFDTIFVDRGRRRDLVRVLEQMGGSLHDELGVVVFPEATSGSGRALLPFKPSLLDFASRRDLPVHFGTISYRVPDGWPPASESVCWWGNAPFLPHALGLLRLPGIEVRVRFGSQPIHDPDRKRLAASLEAAMREIFEPCR